MKRVLTTVAALLIIGWAIGYFEYHVGGFFHFLLVAALIILLAPIVLGGND